MPLRPTRSIRGKLALLVAASVGAAVFLSFAVSSHRELSRFGEAKRAEIQATAEVFATTVSDAVASGDSTSALHALNAIGRIPDVQFAEIRDAGGGVFAEAGTGVALVNAGNPGEATSLWAMLRRGSFFVTADIIRGGRSVGTLGLLVDTSELAARLREALAAAAISAAAAILIGLLVASRLQRSITMPLRALAATMNRVRVSSNFAERAERRSNDETGQLADAFNDMLDQIGRRDTALEEHRAGLEDTVAERTQELAVARDVAESANRAKSDFLATMSHEIRTPMNGMLVMAELLAGTDLPTRQQRYAETIVRSGQTLLTIINDILDISKIEAGKLELEQGRVSVPTIVDDVLGLFWERAASKSLDLAASIGADVPLVIEADPVRLSQILSNLVNNALKFTESGHVALSIERTGADDADAGLVFKVRDTGIGIPADKVDTIFEAFSQADQSTTRRFGGTGLGLSICQRLVTAMGGKIWVESEPGLGSTFAFQIEVKALEPALASAPAAHGIAVVAVAGAATRQVLAATLREAGYDVRPADTGGDEADVVFAEGGRIEAQAGRQGREQTIICVAGVGDGKVDRLIASGRAQGLLTQPVSSVRIREMLAAMAEGKLATLLEARRGEPAADLPALARLDVLVADDSPVNREVVSEALGRLKATVTTVEDGLQAVAAYKAGRFDMVLMDCSMPELDGFAATRAIRAFEAESGRARIPVVALTAHVAGGAADSWQAAGMDDYLTKPFTMRSLADCLARWQPKDRPAEEAARRADDPATDSTAAQAMIDNALDGNVVASLRAIAGGSEAMLERIFRMFQAHAPARLEALKAAVTAGDLERAASEAHALKSPSLNIGALRLGGLCGEFEGRARAGDMALPSTLDSISAELDRVNEAIEQECGGPGIRQRQPVRTQAI